MLVSIIIVNWNKKEDVCNAIMSAYAQDYTNKEIIVVDNGSSDGSVDDIKTKFPDVQITPLDNNIGCPGGRNVGARNANGEILFFLDDDGLYEEKNLISGTVDYFLSNPTIGAVYFKVVNYYSKKTDAPLDRTIDYCDESFPSSSFRGGACAIKTEAFVKAGYYPDDFFRQVEEKFVSLKLFDLGYQVLYFPQFTMLHKCSTYQNKNKVIAKYLLQNELKTIIRLYPLKYLYIYSIAKIITSLKTIIKTNAYKDFFQIISKIPFWLITIRKKNEIVSEDAIKIYESLKYFHANSWDNIDDVKKSYSLFNILRKKI